ncbi:MAG: endonuclease [Paludibacter sp.]|nr:endonuclease [Paludibacter sp.]
MKIWMFFLLSLIESGVWVWGKSEKSVFRMMCYNVENYFDCVDDSLTKDEEYLPGGIRGWNYNRYVRKQHNIARVVASVGAWEPPALVGLCEVESRRGLFELVRGPLKNLHYRFVHYDSPDARGVDVALLYLPELFKVLHDEAISITFVDAPNSTTRDILYVCGKVPTGDTLHVFVCHFPSRLGGELESADRRKDAAMILRKRINIIQENNIKANVLVMGDFNDYPDNASLQEVLQARKPEVPFLPECLYNLMFPLHKEGKGTHKHEAEWGALDQIIVSGQLLDQQQHFYTKPTDVHIFNVDFLLVDDLKYLGKKPFRTYLGMKYTGGFSDHLPVYIDFWY